jgi:hypothetical protein
MSAFIIIHSKGGNIGMTLLHISFFVEHREADLLARLTTKKTYANCKMVSETNDACLWNDRKIFNGEMLEVEKEI